MTCPAVSLCMLCNHEMHVSMESCDVSVLLQTLR